MPDKRYFIFTVWFLLFIYGLANGIYAIVRPAAWLRAKWTATRGLEPEKPLLPGDETGIRWGWGPFFLALSAFWGWGLLHMVVNFFY